MPLLKVKSYLNNNYMSHFYFLITGDSLDILAISCDSFDPETNQTIGRGQGSRSNQHVQSLLKVQQWCAEYKVQFH